MRNIIGGGMMREVAAARRNTKTAAVTNRACGALEASCVRVRLEASPRRRVHILLHPVGFRHVPQTRKRANARHEKFVNTQQLSGMVWSSKGAVEARIGLRKYVDDFDLLAKTRNFEWKLQLFSGPCGRGR